MNVQKLKLETQAAMLQGICSTISKLDDSYFESEDVVSHLLQSLVDALDYTETDDYWGTEGWKVFFGYED